MNDLKRLDEVGEDADRLRGIWGNTIVTVASRFLHPPKKEKLQRPEVNRMKPADNLTAMVAGV